MIRWRILWVVLFWGLAGPAAAENDRVLAPKRVIPDLATVQTVAVEVGLRTRGGTADPQPVVDVLARRLEEIGYAVVTGAVGPHDGSHAVKVRATCEEEPATESHQPLRRSAQASVAGESPQGPPCLVGYLYGGEPMEWQQVDRIIYTESVQAAKEAAGALAGSDPVARFVRFLEQYEFPLLLSAEWGQVERLRTLLDAPDTPRPRKEKIIALLGELRADPAFQCLMDALEDEHLAERAARALGNFGGKARAPLMDLLRTSSRSDTQAAAAYALGLVGATTGDASATPLLVEMLRKPGLARKVQIEIVWALGKAPHFQSHPALEALEQEVWSIFSDDPQLQELRKAIEWTLRQVRQGGHTDAY